jgi:hypothetical protein
MTKLFNALLKKKIKAISVLIVSEDMLAAIAACHYVIYGAYIMQSRFPGHDNKPLSKNIKNANIQSLTPP